MGRWGKLGAYQSHAAPENVDENLIIDGARVEEHKVGHGEMEEGYRGDDGFA